MVHVENTCYKYICLLPAARAPQAARPKRPAVRAPRAPSGAPWAAPALLSQRRGETILIIVADDRREACVTQRAKAALWQAHMCCEDALLQRLLKQLKPKYIAKHMADLKRAQLKLLMA